MPKRIKWTHCRGCRMPLEVEDQDSGFDSDNCKKWYEQERAYETQKAKEAFRKEGEPNRGNV